MREANNLMQPKFTLEFKQDAARLMIGDWSRYDRRDAKQNDADVFQRWQGLQT